MKLYFAPFACSLSPHIALTEAELEFELERVDMKTRRTERGRDYLSINPKGYVPALQLDDGQVLTEGPAIVQYIADLKPEAGLAPPPGSFARYRLQEWLNFVSSELHKPFSPLFAREASQEVRAAAHAKIKLRTATIEQQLAQHAFLLGDAFSVADAYAFTVLNWARLVKLDLSEFAGVSAYLQRLSQRPAITRAVQRELGSRQRLSRESG